ncbi:MAG TPA: glutamate racemase [Anaerolineae bacterium]|nr:glutamate racemase [Anaerolineae bacterium]
MSDPRPIGVFDSGVGGLSVWREIARQLPHEDTLYFADQIHIPYGPRSLAQLRQFSEAIARFLLERECKAIVVACNTASAAALTHLRQKFPHMLFVGMEPAVKPAAATTQTRVVGVLATPATFQGALFASVVERFANGVQLINQVCPGLVEQIEAGQIESPQTDALLRGFLQPILKANADTIVLACTHYPFVIEPIRRIAGPGVNVIDPSPAIARQLGRVLAERGLSAADTRIGQHRFCTTGDRAEFARVLDWLLSAEGQIDFMVWRADRLTLAQAGAS